MPGHVRHVAAFETRVTAVFAPLVYCSESCDFRISIDKDTALYADKWIKITY